MSNFWLSKPNQRMCSG